MCGNKREDQAAFPIMGMKENVKDIILKVRDLVFNEVEIIEGEENDWTCVTEYHAKDSFDDKIFLNCYSEPEDATWERDLQQNFYTGFELGVRNTIKVLLSNTKILSELKELEK